MSSQGSQSSICRERHTRMRLRRGASAAHLRHECRPEAGRPGRVDAVVHVSPEAAAHLHGGRESHTQAGGQAWTRPRER